MADLKIQLIL